MKTGDKVYAIVYATIIIILCLVAYISLISAKYNKNVFREDSSTISSTKLVERTELYLEYKVFVLDSCEYIWIVYPEKTRQTVVHKKNCKFCKERLF
jgi:hypothetical protein